MTYQSKAELFSLYMQGKIDIYNREKQHAIDDMLKAGFGSDERERLAKTVDSLNIRISEALRIYERFFQIFEEDVR